MWNSWRKWSSGKWPQQACTTMFFLIPKNVKSERPIALLPKPRERQKLRSGEVLMEKERLKERLKQTIKELWPWS